MLILVSLEAPQRGGQLPHRASETKFTWDFSVTSDIHDVIPWKEKSKFQVMSPKSEMSKPYALGWYARELFLSQATLPGEVWALFI